MSCLTATKPVALAFLCTLALAAQACRAKPSEEACKDAIENVRRVSGLGGSDVGADPTAAIRSCRANSSKETVDCVRKAKTVAELEKCEGDVAKTNFDEAKKAREDQIDKSTEEKEEDSDKPEEAAKPE